MTGPAATRAATGLTAELTIRLDGFALDLAITVAPGEVVALLGPNGAGKSTALRALAGLRPLDGGIVRLDDRVLDEPDRGTWVPTERRRVAMVFPDHLLFPHLTVLENVAFGPRTAGAPRRAARASAAAWLDRVGVGALAGARPRTLSGGQAQRVALARALVTDPALLLMDEPLSALDARTRVEVRSELRRHLAAYAGCTVVVTHDPLDAAVLADRLVVVEHGRLVQEGTPREVSRRPRTSYVARLVGLNLVRGRADGHRVDVGGIVLTAAEALAGEVFVAFGPTSVAVWATRPAGSPRNVWPATVTGVEPSGDAYRLRLEGRVEGHSEGSREGTVPSLDDVRADVSAGAVAELDLVPGRPVWVSVKAAEVHAYPV